MLSTTEMKRELRTLWKTCFPDSQSVIHYFFLHRYQPENCLVNIKDGKVVSALHLLPAQIVTEDGRCPIQYIYAAATLPEYRNMGCMTQLLLAAENIALERGIPYSAIVPSGQSLFSYYEQVGFVPYFQTHVVWMKREELKGLATAKSNAQIHASARLISTVRNAALHTGIGNLLWDRSAVNFAAEYQAVSKGEVYSASCNGQVGYAFFQKEEQVGVVSELIADEAVFPELARQIYTHCRATLFQFRLPVTSPLFQDAGTIDCTGMIKSNGNQQPIPKAQFPYIGLELN